MWKNSQKRHLWSSKPNYRASNNKCRQNPGSRFEIRQNQFHQKTKLRCDPKKPWHNYKYETQKLLLENLKKKSTLTKKAEDLENYRLQRNCLFDVEESLMHDYFKNNPSQENFWLPILAMEDSQCTHFCDICEMCFQSKKSYFEHENKHEICELEGCTFTSNSEKMTEHVLLLHASGLFSRLSHGDNEKDVSRWRKERKEKFPSLSVMKEQHEKKKKILDFKEAQKKRFVEETEFHNNNKLLKTHVEISSTRNIKKLAFKNRKKERYSPIKHDIKEPKVSKYRRMNNENPGKSCCGINMFYGIDLANDLGDASNLQIKTDFNKKCDDTGKYGLNLPNSRKLFYNEACDDPPNEVPIEKSKENYSILNAENSAKEVLHREKILCKNNSVFNNIKNDIFPKSSNIITKLSPFTQSEIRYFKKSKKPPTLLEKLLLEEIHEERDKLLQCIKYVVEKGFFSHELKDSTETQ